MEITRRNFLSLAALSVPVVPRFLAAATERGRLPAGDDVLVVLQLTGGNDGLGMVIPFDDAVYQRSRPTLGIGRDQALRLGDGGGIAGSGPGRGPGPAEIGLHPRMTALRDLYPEGMVAIVQGVGSANPSRSHSRSMEVWHTARPEAQESTTGWIGAALDASRGRLAGIDVGDDELPLALRGGPDVPGIRNLDWIDYLGTPGGRDLARRLGEVNARPRSGETEAARSIARTTLDELSRVAEIRKNPSPVESPSSGVAERLSLAAGLIGGGFGARVYYLSHGGFDTHAQEKEVQALLLAQLSDALGAFFRHLRALGKAERVTVCVFSEFGRRVAENGSLGTYHGMAAPVLVLGGSVRGGLHGAHPSLEDLEDGDLRFHTDFRQVYATLLEGVLGGDFGRLDLLRRRGRRV